MLRVKWLGVLALAAILQPASAATVGAISIMVNADNVLNYDFTYNAVTNTFSDTRIQTLGGVNGDVAFNLVSTGDADDPLVRQTGVITNLSTLVHTYTIAVGIPLGFSPDPDSTVLGPFTRAISSMSGTLTDATGGSGAASFVILKGFNSLLPPGPSLNVDTLALCIAPSGSSGPCPTGKITDFAPTVFDNLSFELQFSLDPNDTFSYEALVQLTNTPASSVPEPSTFLLVFAGLAGVTYFRRR